MKKSICILLLCLTMAVGGCSTAHPVPVSSLTESPAVTAVPTATPAQTTPAPEPTAAATTEPGCELEGEEYTLTYPMTVGDRTFTLKLYGKVLSCMYGLRDIEVYESDKLIQTISMKDAILKEWKEDDFGGYTQAFDKEGGLTLTDMNFDGYNDIGVTAWTTAGANIPAYYWLWNEKEQQFVYAFCLDNAEADPKTKQIVTGTREGANVYHTDYYEFDKSGQLIHVKRIIETYDEAGKSTSTEQNEFPDETPIIKN